MSLSNLRNDPSAIISSLESLQEFLPVASPTMIQQRAQRTRLSETTIARVGPSGLLVASLTREGEFKWGFSVNAMVRLARQGFHRWRSKAKTA